VGLSGGTTKQELYPVNGSTLSFSSCFLSLFYMSTCHPIGLVLLLVYPATLVVSLKVLTLHKGTDSPTSRKNCQFLYPIILYETMKCPITSIPSLVKGDGRLNSRLVAHSLKALLPLLNLVHLVDNTTNLNFPRIKVINSSRELVCLRETTKDSNLIAN
jgi:hypothetical protein